jgi:hypothetical protein
MRIKFETKIKSMGGSLKDKDQMSQFNKEVNKKQFIQASLMMDEISEGEVESSPHIEN